MTKMIANRLLLLFTLAGLGVLPPPTAAQTPAASAPRQTFSLQDALQYATDHYPSVKAAIEEVNASSAGVNRRRAPAARCSRHGSRSSRATARATSSPGS
jgi:hypothetical protein